MSTLYRRLKGKELMTLEVVRSDDRRQDSKQPADRTIMEASSPGNFLDPLRELKNRIQSRLAAEMDYNQIAEAHNLSEARKREIRQKLSDLLEGEEGIGPFDKERVVRELYAEITGFGPIQSLLEDPEITEIMVNGVNRVYIEREGRLELTGVRFEGENQIRQLIDKIVAPLGRRIDEASPMVDARLPDGSRVNAVIPPLSIKGPVITVRKFARDPLTMSDLVSMGTLTERMAAFIDAAVKARLNIVVSGGTGSGKTTMLNVLSSFIPPDQRIITIEDAAELQLQQEHVLSLETRPPNIEERGEVTVRHLVRNALRMRPDRIIVGEVRGGEALDMLQAMNTGHDGSLTTIHANSPRDVLSRLEVMALLAGFELPIRAIREQISSALDLVVHQVRLRDGTRKVSHITEVQGMEGDVVVMQDVFVFDQLGIDSAGRVRGRFRATGIQPTFLTRFDEEGVKLPDGLFEPDEVVERRDLDLLAEEEDELPEEMLESEPSNLRHLIFQRNCGS